MRRAGAVLAATAAWLVLLPAGALGASSESIQKELDRVAAAYGKVESELARTEAKQRSLEKERGDAERIVSQKADALRQRAGYMYKHGGFSSLMGQLLTSNSLGTFIKRMHYISVLGSSDAELVDAVVVNQARADEIREQLAATERRQESLAERLASQRESLEERYAEVRQAEQARRRAAQEQLRSRRIADEAKRRQLEATAKGATPARVSSAGRFSRFTLPIAGPAGFADTWGAPRSGGRRHQGTDVMAPCGARVVAVTDGQITRLMRHGNGGIMAYMRANNGDVFLYSHLQSYAPGVAAGKRVSAGEQIGANGNTGNARGGPCHVHFEWHPGGGRPVNPYSLLASAR
jgi:murein DD-endopeptidase MepM/ murein hydrolase activator NlpD